MPDAEVIIRLTLAEAVVLDGLLRRYADTGRLVVEDQAEQRALWNLQCVIEREDEESWPSLARARDELRDEGGEA